MDSHPEFQLNMSPADTVRKTQVAISFALPACQPGCLAVCLAGSLPLGQPICPFLPALALSHGRLSSLAHCHAASLLCFTVRWPCSLSQRHRRHFPFVCLSVWSLFSLSACLSLLLARSLTPIPSSALCLSSFVSLRPAARYLRILTARHVHEVLLSLRPSLCRLRAAALLPHFPPVAFRETG